MNNKICVAVLSSCKLEYIFMRVEFYICSLYLFFVNYMNTSTCNQVRKKVLSLHQQQKFSMVVFIAVHQIVTVCLIVYTTRVVMEALRRYLVKFEGSNTKTKFTRTQYKRLRIAHLVIHSHASNRLFYSRKMGHLS